MLAQFDKYALQYDRYSQVQEKIAHLLFPHLEGLGGEPRHIMDLGCGTGLFTKLLLDRYRNAYVTAIDNSPNMLNISRQKLSRYDKLSFIRGDVEEHDLGTGYDLITANAVAQWFRQPEQTIARLAKSLTHGGRIAFSTFGPQTLEELKLAFRHAESKLGLEPTLHHLEMRSSPSWKHIFEQATRRDVLILEEPVRFYYEDCWALLESIKKIGASYSQSGHRHSTGEMYQVLREAISYYDSTFRDSNRVYATYHFIFILM